MKKKQTSWFVKVRGSYLPSAWQGWALYVPYLAYIVWVPLYVWQRQFDLSDTLLILVPNWTAALAVMTWIAARKSKRA